MNRLITIIVMALLLVSCAEKPLPLALQLTEGNWIDLTHDFDSHSVYWPTNKSFSKDTVAYGINDQGYFYASFIYTAEEHGGTHFDAPLHFSESGKTVEQIPLSQLMGPGVVVDVSEKALANRDYLVSTEDFLDWERSHGNIPAGAIVLLYTGFGKFWPDLEAYTGTFMTGAEAVPHLSFPGLSPEAATWLVENRQIHAIGLDTPSIDYGQSKDFMAHRILCAANLTIYENIANLHLLPPIGSFVMALPMKIKGGSGAPLRIVALLP